MQNKSRWGMEPSWTGIKSELVRGALKENKKTGAYSAALAAAAACLLKFANTAQVLTWNNHAYACSCINWLTLTLVLAGVLCALHFKRRQVPCLVRYRLQQYLTRQGTVFFDHVAVLRLPVKLALEYKNRSHNSLRGKSLTANISTLPYSNYL